MNPENDIDNDMCSWHTAASVSRVYLINLRDRLKKELAELERVIAASQPRSSPRSKSGYGAVAKDVWSAISLCGGTFTIRDVKEHLKALGADLGTVQIATVLARLTKQGKIKTAQPKRGNIPAIYQKTST